ncbi:MAG TPA: glycosyltransferase [Thermoanaerobaculia bacterium]|nr:glycosyltransferase [Thermoanaerobaculia bacterium]
MSEALAITVLPMFEEKENVEPLLAGLLRACPPPHRLLVVDDSSPDGTGEAVRGVIGGLAPADGARVALLTRTERGLTSAIQRGVDEALASGATCVTWMDCDLSMSGADVPRLLAELAGGADVAVGSRYVPGGADRGHAPLGRVASRSVNAVARAWLGRAVHDWTSGFVAARAEVLRELRLRGDYGESCIDFLARALERGFVVREVPYVCAPRAAGISKTADSLRGYLWRAPRYLAAILAAPRSGV